MTEKDQPRIRSTVQTGEEPTPFSPFLPVAEDLEWFCEEWYLAGAPPSNGTLRRGSASLRQLLCHGIVQRAWRYHGLDGRPEIKGPDALSIAAHQDQKVRHAVSVITGGAAIDGVQYAMLGSWRVDNLSTGISADADQGFAVGVGSVTCDVRGKGDPGEPNELTGLVEKSWSIDAYLSAPGAIRRGKTISRRAIIEFFANYAGGVHLDRVVGNGRAEKKALYELAAELEERVTVDKVEGLYFELLSIGQAVGQSVGLQMLAKAIRTNERRGVDR